MLLARPLLFARQNHGGKRNANGGVASGESTAATASNKEMRTRRLASLFSPLSDSHFLSTLPQAFQPAEKSVTFAPDCRDATSSPPEVAVKMDRLKTPLPSKGLYLRDDGTMVSFDDELSPWQEMAAASTMDSPSADSLETLARPKSSPTDTISSTETASTTYYNAKSQFSPPPAWMAENKDAGEV